MKGFARKLSEANINIVVLSSADILRLEALIDKEVEVARKQGYADGLTEARKLTEKLDIFINALDRAHPELKSAPGESETP